MSSPFGFMGRRRESSFDFDAAWFQNVSTIPLLVDPWGLVMGILYVYFSTVYEGRGWRAIGRAGERNAAGRK